MFNWFAILDKLLTSIQYKYRITFVLVQGLNIGVFGSPRTIKVVYK